MEIGRVFGGRDHTTVLYACDKIGRRINAEEAFREKVNSLIAGLASG
jgi:chromosomal replication initiator protein